MPIGLAYWKTDPHEVFPYVGHIFVPMLIQMPNYVFGGGGGKSLIALLNAVSLGAREWKDLHSGCVARVRRDG
jgi:hypothetical protein